MDMGNFTIHVKSKDIYADLAGDVKKRLERSKYEIFKIKNSKKDHYQSQKQLKMIGLIKDELGGKKAKNFVRSKAYTGQLF